MGMDAARGVLAMLEGRAFEAPRYGAEWVARGSTAAARLEAVR